MDPYFDAESTALLATSFEIDGSTDKVTEEELLFVLSERIGYLIDHKFDFLMHLMYRFDVLEHKIRDAISPTNEDPANVALAKLVIDRQKERIILRQKYKSPEIEDLDGWEF